jgi:putative flippase GtrA
MFLTIFGYFSTTAHLLAFALNLLSSHIFYILEIPVFQYVITTAIISGIVLRLKLYQLGVSNSVFLKYQLLSKAIGAIMLPYEVKTILKYLVNRRLTFSVTPKSETALSLWETVSLAKATILIMGLLTFGLVLVNPLGLIYNITWLAPFFVSPLIIFLFSKEMHARHNNLGIGFPTATNGSPTRISCQFSQPEVVNALISNALTK